MSVLGTTVVIFVVWPLVGLFFAGLSGIVHYYWGKAMTVNADNAIEWGAYHAILGPLAFFLFIGFLVVGIWNKLTGGKDTYHVIVYRTKDWYKK